MEILRVDQHSVLGSVFTYLLLIDGSLTVEGLPWVIVWLWFLAGSLSFLRAYVWFVNVGQFP